MDIYHAQTHDRVIVGQDGLDSNESVTRETNGAYSHAKSDGMTGNSDDDENWAPGKASSRGLRRVLEAFTQLHSEFESKLSKSSI